MRRVVSDTGPVLHLSEARALDLLEHLGEIHIPATVDAEIRRYLVDWSIQRPAWIIIDTLARADEGAAAGWVQAGLLHTGEAAAIALAQQLSADWLLTDEWNGMKKKRRWEQTSMKLAPDHGYRARPGGKIFVIDRGAVRFDLPGEWNITPKEGSCVLKTPEDDCLLEISHFALPPIDRSRLSMTRLLQDVDKIAGHYTTEDRIVHIQREDIEIVWSEHTYIDPSENREAILRTCLASGTTVHILINYAFWPECRERFHAVWEEILGTLQLGHFFADPRVGPRLH